LLQVSHARLQLLCGVAALVVPVSAQAAPAAPATAASAPAADQTTPAPAANDATAAAPAGGLADIVVTATRRETNLQSTPVAINVLNTQALQDRHVQSLYDLADGAVPSLRVATFEARQSALTIGIRGIVPLDANQPAREQGVGIYVDGIYLGRQHGLNAALFDVERIEVLKGPQGTLFGRNTEGGALSIVTRAPSGEFGGRVRLGVANLGGYNGDVHLDLPEYANFSVKLDAVKQYQGAVTQNPLPGQVGFGYYDREAVRGAIRWQPIQGLTNDFAYDYGRDKNSPFYSQLLNANPNNCVAGAQAASPKCVLPGTAYTTLTGAVRPVLPVVQVNGSSRMRRADIGVVQQPSVDQTHGFTNVLKYKATPDIELRSLTAWRGVDVAQWDNSGGAHRVPLLNCTAATCNFSRYSIADLRQRQFSQEFQAVGTIDAFDFVGGLYYFNEHVSDDAATPNSQQYNQATGVITTLDPCIGGGSVAAPAGWQIGCRQIDRASEVWSKSYAAYGQLTWNATDAIHITAGGRYTHDTKRGVLHFSRNINYDNPANAAIVARNGYQPLDKTWNRFNPMVTVAYDATRDLHFYAKYATGYRAGGASSRTSNYQAFNPEDVRSYEVGMKSDLFDRRVRFNLAGYIMDRDNSQVDISSIQVTATGNFNNLVTINAPGTTRIRGVEADLTVNPMEGLTLNASYAYTYTRIPKVNIVNSVTTNGVTTSTTVPQQFYIVFTPRNAASGAIDYAVPVGDGNRLTFHLDGNYAQATQAFDQFATKADASLIFNGRVALGDIPLGTNGQKLTVAIWGRNLFDEQYVYRRDPSNSLPGAPTTNVTSGSINNVLGDYGNFNAPRTFGVEGTVNF
jgi:iron complex outermembrane receptor protein